MIKFTPSIWERILGFDVIDPDGWNRRSEDWDAEWNAPLTFNEFMDKADNSTCTRHPDRNTLRHRAFDKLRPSFQDAFIWNEINFALAV